MKKIAAFTALALLGSFAVSLPFRAATEATVLVGGRQMAPNKDIIDDAVNSSDHTTLVAAVKAADLPRDRLQLMVSLEPAGGRPEGLPTGPALYAGTLTRTE